MLQSPGVPWNLDVSLMALIYLSIGFFYKDKIKQLSEFESRKYDLAAGAVAVALVIFCWFIYTDGNRLYYFDMKPVYYKDTYIGSIDSMCIWNGICKDNLLDGKNQLA